jgi:fructokinase
VSLLERPPADPGSLAEADWRELVSFAADAAAINCTREGADPPRRQELETFIGEQRQRRRSRT